MSLIPENLKFATSHEWVLVEGETAVVGVSDHAQAELTDVVFVDLPETGRQVSAGDASAVVESVKAASDIYSPVSGEIVEVNDALSGDPALINNDPYGNGWIFKLRISNPEELDALMNATDYAAHLGE